VQTVPVGLAQTMLDVGHGLMTTGGFSAPDRTARIFSPARVKIDNGHAI
jgi:hypothetical protein